MSAFWLSPIKEDSSEEEEMTILDYNNEFKKSQNKEDIIKFSSIISEEEFLTNNELSILNGRNILLNVTLASKFFYSPKQEYLRLFLEGFILAFFEDEPQYNSHIKRKLKMKDVTKLEVLSENKIRLEFGKKDFIEFEILDEPHESQSMDEIDINEENSIPIDIKPEMVIKGLKEIINFLKKISQPIKNFKVGDLNLDDDKKDEKLSKEQKKIKSILRLAKQVNSVTNLDKRQSAMYINRHSRDETSDSMGKMHLMSIEEESPELKKEKLIYIKAKQIMTALKMAEKDFLELDLQIHKTLEEENHILQDKIEKKQKKFIKATKPLQKVLKYSKNNKKKN